MIWVCWVSDTAQNGTFLGKGAARDNRFLMCVHEKKYYPHPTSLFQKYCFFKWKYVQKYILVSNVALATYRNISFQRAPGLRSHTAFKRNSWPKLFHAQFIWGRGKWSIYLPLQISFSSMRLNQVGCHTRSCHQGYDITWLKQPRATDVRQIAFDTQGRFQSMCLLSRTLCV